MASIVFVAAFVSIFLYISPKARILDFRSALNCNIPNRHITNKIGIASPAHTRAFCFIDDAVEFTIRICEYINAINEVVNIGNPKEEIAIKDLVVKMANIMDKQITFEELPDTSGSPKRRCPNISKIERLTGYAPTVSLEEGIRKTYDWYKDRISESQ